MARSYRARDDGLFEVETPGVGFMPVHLGEDDLRAQGFEPYAGATAFGLNPDRPRPFGAQGKNETATDAPAPSPDAQGITQQDWQRGRIQDALAPYLPAAGARNPAELLRARERAEQLQKGPQFDAGPEAFDQLRKGSGEFIMPGDLKKDVEAGKKVNDEKPEAKGGVKTKPLALAGQSEGEAPAARGAGGARYATTRAQDVRAAFRVEKGPKISDEAQEQRSDAEIDMRLAEQDQADKDEERGHRDVERYENKVLVPEERRVSQDEVKLAALRKEFATRQADIDKERAAVDKLEVNPRELFEDAPWSMAIAGVAMIAGGMLQGFQGRGNNPGMEAVQRAVDQSIQLQKDKIERRRQGVNDKETALEKLEKRYGSPELAEAELRNRQMALVEAWAKKNMMKDAADDVQANLRAAWADGDMKRAQERQQIDLQFGDRVTEEWRHQPAQTVQVGGSKPLNKDARERMVRLPDGSWGFVRDKQDKAKVQEQFTSGGAVVSGLNKLQRLLEQSDLPMDEKRAAAQSTAAGLALDIKNAEAAGALDAGMQQVVGDMISDPRELFTPNAAARIQAARERQLGKLNGIQRDYTHRDAEGTMDTVGAGPRSARSDE